MGRISTLPLNIPHQTDDELYEKLLVAQEVR